MPFTSAGVTSLSGVSLRLDVVVLDVRHQQADGGKHAGIERHDHARHAEVAGDAAGMQRSGAAEGEQHEVAQVVAAHGGDRLDRLLHLHVDDADDAFGRLGDVQAERPGDLGLDRGARLGGIEPHAAAEEIVFAEIAEHEVAVGDGRRRRRRGRSRPAPAPRRRSAGRPASTPKRSTVAMVPPPALTVLMSSIGTARSRPSILPRLDSSGSPSLISATSQEVPPMSKVMMLADPLMRQASTPAVTPPAGPDSTVVTARRAAAANVAMPPFDCMMYFCRVRDAGAGEALVELRDIARQDRLQVGVDDGRAQPIILADLRQHLGRERDAAAGHFLEHDLAHARLVLGMQEREQQAHRDRLDVLRLELAHGFAQRRLVERRAARCRGNRPAPSPRRCRLAGTSGAGLSYMTSKIAVP